MITALIWAVGGLAVEGGVDYARLLRCTGFAYAWFALLVGYSLPLVGPLFAWAGVLLSLASLVIATREVLATDTARAFAICVLALGLPLMRAVLAAGVALQASRNMFGSLSFPGVTRPRTPTPSTSSSSRNSASLFSPLATLRRPSGRRR